MIVVHQYIQQCKDKKNIKTEGDTKNRDIAMVLKKNDRLLKEL